MRILVKTTWLLPILVIRLAILVVRFQTSTSHQVLADGPPTADEPQGQVEGAQPPAFPGPAEPVAEEPNLPGAADQLDEGTHGTY